MDAIYQYKTEIVKKSLFAFLSICALCVLLSKGILLVSLLFGYSMSVINFHLLALDISKIAILRSSKYSSLLMIKFFMRYAMLALAMVIAFKYTLNIPLFVFGLFFIQIMIVVDNVFNVKQV